MMVLRHLDASLDTDCCVLTLSNITGLKAGTIHNRLTRLLELDLVCKAKEIGDPSELGRPLKYYFSVTDLGILALDYTDDYQR
ncbi:MAG: hypothetical protein ABW168_09080 [Sedimenticola sp.]